MKHDGLTIGIVAIQGDYEAHAKVLARLGVAYKFARTPADLAELAGVILPGGESTTHLKVMTEEGLFDALKKFAAADGAFFGTCAGTILLAKEVHGPAQASLGLLDASVLRNGYGRQLASDVHMGHTKLRAQPLEMVFIRAPRIVETGQGVEILARREGFPVLVRQISGYSTPDETVLSRIERQTLPADKFQIPQGFTETQLDAGRGSD